MDDRKEGGGGGHRGREGGSARGRGVGRRKLSRRPRSAALLGMGDGGGASGGEGGCRTHIRVRGRQPHFHPVH